MTDSRVHESASQSDNTSPASHLSQNNRKLGIPAKYFYFNQMPVHSKPFSRYGADTALMGKDRHLLPFCLITAFS